MVSRLTTNPCLVNSSRLMYEYKHRQEKFVIYIYSLMDQMCPCVDRCSNTGYIGSIKDEVMCGLPLSSQRTL